ncbi:MAG: DUF1592 domain-containing protein [Fuerstiella sp.]|nr:DUF1592 domain-containing protein [Fuerstiella sp.]
MTVFYGSSFATGDETASFSTIGENYERNIRPLMRQLCLDCHSAEQREGELDLEQFANLSDVRRVPGIWLKIAEMLDNGEMPPKDSTQPSTQEKRQLRDWIKQYLHNEALAGAGDPGSVVLRRLTNAEYRYTVRDLTNVDINPVRNFPTNSAAGEGFTNTGIAMVMSPAMLQKYFGAGREIAAHAVLLPSGFRFSRHTTRRDWRNEILSEIREFYSKFVSAEKLGTFQSNLRFSLGQAGLPPMEKYLVATLTERTAIMTGTRTIETVASQYGLNARYLRILWSSLTDSKPSLILDKLRSRWRSSGTEDAAALVADIAGWQKGLWTFGPVGLYGKKGAPARWMQPVNPLVTQQDIRLAIELPETPNTETQDDVVISLVVTDAGDGNDQDFVVFQQPRLVASGHADIDLKDLAESGLDPGMFGSHPNGKAIDAASICVRAPSVIRIHLPIELAANREFVTTAVLEKDTGSEGTVQVLPFTHSAHDTPSVLPGLVTCDVTTEFTKTGVLVAGRDRNVSFTGAILVSENSTARQRIETAMDDYRSVFPAAFCYTQIVPVDEILTMTLFHREDDHLARLMLDEEQSARLDRLWEELLYVSHSPLMRFDAMDLVLEVLAGNEAPDFQARYNLFKPMRAPLKKLAADFRQTLIKHEPRQIEALINFTSRAWRHPLTDVEADRLRGLYHQLRRQELSHDEAFRLTLARVFVASPFLYRLENVPKGSGTAEVSNWELANRLSYFLWSSMPDVELRAAAQEERLTHRHETNNDPGNTKSDSASGEESDETDAELLRQTKRMLSDARIRRLASEFACQWIRTYDFGSLGRKSEKYFPEFADVRGDMHEESIRFFTDLFQQDGSLLSLLDADHTFVNERLATFYGIQGVEGTDWRRIDGMRQYGRGGILGLAATLAKHSGAARTSPILRGNWVSEVLLGEKLPRPPKNVPQLATTVPEGLTERQLIEQHSSDAACAKCHIRIDPFGFALENFDTIGRRRDTDRVIDVQTTLPDGTSIQGLPGLRDYLLNKRRNTFVYQFCRKLLGYSVGREVQLTDEPLLAEMQRQLKKHDYRISVAVNTIVLSDQFRRIRGLSYNR